MEGVKKIGKKFLVYGEGGGPCVYAVSLESIIGRECKFSIHRPAEINSKKLPLCSDTERHTTPPFIRIKRGLSRPYSDKLV